MKAIADIFRMDTFGVILVMLIFLFVSIIRFWVLDPSLIYAGNCVPCVIAVVFFVAAFVSLLLTVFWQFWAARAPITMGFYFILGGLGVLCAMLVNKVAQAFVNTIYFKGFIDWQEDTVPVLLEQIVPHLTGLYLGSLMFYLALRMVLVKEIESRKVLALTSVIIAGASSGVLFLGIKMY